jgi:hypothetical protein
MNASIEKTVNELLDIMADVSASYAVWRELTDANNRDLYESIKEGYEDFFQAIDRANLAMVINGLHMLLEDKSNTDNLQAVLKRQRSLGRLYEARVDKWLSEIASWQPSIKKVILIRSNVFAHRGGKATASEFMRQAAITPDEIGKLIRSTETLLKDFAEAVLFNVAVLPFGGQTTASTKQLMLALRRTE